MKEYSYGICPYKIKNGTVYILLNKTHKKSMFNFFKGKQENNETKIQTAIREFYEEAGVLVDEKYLEEYYYHNQPRKNIGIYLVDITNIKGKFKYDKREIYSSEWIDIFSEINISNNQSIIYNKIFLFFKPKLKSIRLLKC